MGKFDLFNKLDSAVIIINENKETVFINNVFKRIFDDFDTIKKFSHKLYYDACALESNDMTVYSPILQALNSNVDFFAHVLYQSSSNNYYYFDMNAAKKGKYTVIILKDVTANVNLDNLKKRNQDYQEKIKQLEDDNKNLSKIKLLAQSQAMKLLLLNNISNIIRGSIDSSVILKSALSELSELFGASTVIVFRCRLLSSRKSFKVCSVLNRCLLFKLSDFKYKNWEQ